jgi:hypothetical protein
MTSSFSLQLAVGVVVDGARDERRLAGVADPGSAGPADGYVAGFGDVVVGGDAPVLAAGATS